MARGLGDLPVLDVLAAVLLRLPLLLAVVVDEGVREDPVEPRLEVGPRGVLVESCVGLRVRLLHEILGVGGVAGHPQSRRVELVEVLEGVALETSRALCVGLGLGGFSD